MNRNFEKVFRFEGRRLSNNIVKHLKISKKVRNHEFLMIFPENLSICQTFIRFNNFYKKFPKKCQFSTFGKCFWIFLNRDKIYKIFFLFSLFQ